MSFFFSFLFYSFHFSNFLSALSDCLSISLSLLIYLLFSGHIFLHLYVSDVYIFTFVYVYMSVRMYVRMYVCELFVCIGVMHLMCLCEEPSLALSYFFLTPFPLPFPLFPIRSPFSFFLTLPYSLCLKIEIQRRIFLWRTKKK